VCVVLRGQVYLIVSGWPKVELKRSVFGDETVSMSSNSSMFESINNHADILYF
jgi:hypothetical protein